MKRSFPLQMSILLLVLLFSGLQASAYYGFQVTSGSSLESRKGSSQSDRDALALTLGALLLGSTSGPFLAISRANRNKATVNRFVMRYNNSPKAVKKHLKRMRGKHYKWVRDDLLQVGQENEYRFNCEIKRDKSGLNFRLKHATTEYPQSIRDLGKYLITIAGVARNDREICALEDRYMQNRDLFRNTLFSKKKRNEVRIFIEKYVKVSPYFRTKYACLLSKKKAKLKEVFKVMGQKSTRTEGVKQLDKILKETGEESKKVSLCQ